MTFELALGVWAVVTLVAIVAAVYRLAHRRKAIR